MLIVISKVILHAIIDIHSIHREAIIYGAKRENMKVDNGQQGHLIFFPLECPKSPPSPC